MSKFKTTIFQENSGFSILEVLAAVAVIVIALVGIVALVIQNLEAYSINKDAFIASQLAQEGLEMVRNRRDANWRATPAVSWDQGITGTYRIDKDGAIVAVSGINDDTNGTRIYLYNNFYSHNTAGQQTKFRRMITSVDRGEYLEVLCLVQWTEKSSTKNYQAGTLLYNWK